MKHIELALKEFSLNEDLDNGEENLRKAITSLAELRFALAVASQEYPDEYNDILETLISLN